MNRGRTSRLNHVRKNQTILLEKIICRFGIPVEIVSDNDKAIVYFGRTPQSNGQAEATNKIILQGLRKRLEEAKGRWEEELPHVLWSYHTTPHSTTNETPFFLTFGTEAMIPVEIGEPSPRIALFEPSKNEEELRGNLDLLQEAKEIAHIREYAMKARAARKYDRGVIPQNFEAGDLVLKKKKKQANTVLGGTVQGNRRSWPRSVSPGKPGKEKVALYVECRLSANVLQLDE
ncbi:Tf2-11, partial [Mucuna pruriens]